MRWCVFIWLLATSPALAAVPDEPTQVPAASTSVLALPFAAHPSCATEEQREQLLAGLRLRLPELAIERLALAAPDIPSELPQGALVWGLGPDETCTLSLDTVDGRASIPLDVRSSDAEIRAAVVRIAWWLELRARHDAQHIADLPPDARQTRDEPPSRPKAGPPGAYFGVQFGSSWYPTPANVSGILRICAFLPVSPHLQLGLEARIGTEVAVYAPLDVDAFDRSLGLIARYEAPLSAVSTLGVSFGVRYALLEIDVDKVESVSVVHAASNLSFASGVGASWQIVDELRLRGDLLAGFSIGSRRLESNEGLPAGDLGVFTLDLVLGFELSL